VSFWQAYRKASWIALQSLLLLLPFIAIGAAASWLAINQHYVWLALFVMLVVLIAIGLQARSIQLRQKQRADGR
jgi:hypothetical protein